MAELVNYFEEGLNIAWNFIYTHSPELTSAWGMIFYSLIVYMVLFSMRYFRNVAIYPRIERNINDNSNKKRAEIRKKRS